MNEVSIAASDWVQPSLKQPGQKALRDDWIPVRKAVIFSPNEINRNCFGFCFLSLVSGPLAQARVGSSMWLFDKTRRVAASALCV